MRELIPKSTRRWILRQTRRPPVGKVDMGDLRRTRPFSRRWGGDRGLPIDRYYIERFLEEKSVDIRGRVLEVGNDTYTRRFGGAAVTQSDILHVDSDHERATIIADLTAANHIESGQFNCIICTQTLQLIFDVPAAVRTLHRILKPGGVLLATVPGISQIARPEMDQWGDFWRFTSLSAQKIHEQIFLRGTIEVQTAGNVLSTAAFLYGLAADEIADSELAHIDPDYQLVILVRATKGSNLSEA